MKPLIVLFGTFFFATAIAKFLGYGFSFASSGRIAMAAMLLFTAVGHFVYTNGMSMMLPPFVPFKKTFVYLTGIIEILAAVGLLIPHLRVFTGWFLIAFFIFILPANIYAAIKRVDYQKNTNDGNGIQYLWFRVPLQMLFILWVYFSSIVNQQ